VPQTNTFDPEIHMESLSRCLKEYAEDGFKNAVEDESGNPSGDQLYDIVMEFPGTEISSMKVPLEKTLIHFAIDDVEDRVVGIGDNIFADNYEPITDTVNPQEAKMHMVNFDVGVWSSDRSGGVTSRLRAQQILLQLFLGSIAQTRIREATHGGDGCLEILKYSGGNFATERINDVDVYRMMGAELVIRVFSRTPISDEPLPAIESLVQVPGLTIL
jgi:hypothetical protein